MPGSANRDGLKWCNIKDKKSSGIIKVSISIPSDTVCQITIVAQEHHDLLGIAHRTSYWTYALSIVPNGFFDLLLVLIATKVLLRSIVLTVYFPINFAIHFICWSMKKMHQRRQCLQQFWILKKNLILSGVQLTEIWQLQSLWERLCSRKHRDLKLAVSIKILINPMWARFCWCT